MSDESDNYEIGEDIDVKKHDKIVEEVLNLNKIQNVKKPSRTEPSLNISEFNLVKSGTGGKGSVHLNALTKVLKGRKKHEIISQKVKSTNSKSKTLPTPLEKPQAERIRRTVNYEKSRLQFDRWEALVTSNRAAAQLLFPLNSTEKLKIEERKAETYPSTWRIKSELQTKLEELEPKVEEYHIDQEEKLFPLTLNELKEHRREAAKLRAHQSYKEAKARRQNKIKSKKYHRILRREKIKNKLKEFEELQKTNPEEALKKLEDIERARAEERFSLRHKGTGQWARNKQIRAKYDKESRQVLAQQLAISRDLTQKLKNVDSESEEENIDVEVKSSQNPENADNPWVSGMKPSKEMEDFVSGYRKYWNEKNGNEKLEESKPPEDENNENKSERKPSKKDLKKTPKAPKNKETVSVKQTEDKIKGKVKSNNKKNVKLSKKDSGSTSEWEVSLLKNCKDVEDIFDKLEEKLEKKIKDKYKKLKDPNKVKKNKKSKAKKTSNDKTKKIDLSFPTKAKKPVIDEQMIEEQGNGVDEDITDDTSNSDLNSLKNILSATVDNGKTSNIDPHKFMEVKTTHLNTAIPDILTVDENENEEDNSQREVILEAFEDDDIADDFKKEKENEIKSDTPGDIDLNLPGWGVWSGTNIKTRKRRRFIIKMPAKIPRRDDNKGSLIINEKAQSKVKRHRVSELPFPFKTIKDYEASIRAPTSNTFVPEAAFRRLVEPSVITKMGAIIEPITESILMGEKRV